mgnify:FL=1
MVAGDFQFVVLMGIYDGMPYVSYGSYSVLYSVDIAAGRRLWETPKS